MVVASSNPIIKVEKVQTVELPTIDLSGERSEVAKQIVKACEEYGFFKVKNHGVAEDIIAGMEEEALNFFRKPPSEKQKAGPANPYGYGCKNIGLNGDVGELEYLLLHTNPISLSQSSISISNDRNNFRTLTTAYIESVRKLACEISELMGEGLWVTDASVWSRMIRDVDSDSLFRLNHYPPFDLLQKGNDNLPVGFGEHTDPQILTLLRSNDVGGLQISVHDGMWVAVPPDPTAFFVNVGDVLQAMTNGRFLSVRHRALTNSSRPRMSMAYFAAPPLHAWIEALPEMLSGNGASLYRPFTWADYKKAAYTRRLGDSRLEFFRGRGEDRDGVA